MVEPKTAQACSGRMSHHMPLLRRRPDKLEISVYNLTGTIRNPHVICSPRHALGKLAKQKTPPAGCCDYFPRLWLRSPRLEAFEGFWILELFGLIMGFGILGFRV